MHMATRVSFSGGGGGEASTEYQVKIHNTSVDMMTNTHTALKLIAAQPATQQATVQQIGESHAGESMRGPE